MCGELFGGCIDLKLPDNNLCNLGVICPVKSGDNDVVKISIFVNPNYPPVSQCYLMT